MGPFPSSLVELARQGDREAVQKLLSRAMNMARSRFLKSGIESTEIDDLVQETALRIFTVLPAVRSNKAFFALLLRIIRNVQADFLRTQKKHRKLRFVSPRELSAVCPFDPANSLELKELKQGIERSVRNLPTRLWNVFFLWRIHGLTEAKIALILGISLTTVKRWKTELRKALRRGVPGIKDISTHEKL